MRKIEKVQLRARKDKCRILERGTIGEYLALAALSLYVASELAFGSSELTVSYPMLARLKILGLFEDLSMALAIVSIAKRARMFSFWQVLLALSSLSFLLMSASVTGAYYLVHSYILIIAVSGIGLERLCRVYYYSVIPIIMLIIILSITGFVYNKDVIPNSRLVFSFGFVHPNVMGIALLSAVGAMSFACWNRSNWRITVAISLASSLFAYFFLSAHASSALLLAVSIIVIVGHVFPRNPIMRVPRRVLLSVLVSAPMALLCVMLICTAFYEADNSMFPWFNDLIHGRPFYAHSYYEENGGFTLFGREYSRHPSSYHSGLPFTSVDSGYAFFGLVIGLVPMLLVMTTYCIAMWRLCAKDSRAIVACFVLLYALLLTVESTLSIPECFPILFLSEAFSVNENSRFKSPL